MSENKKTRFVGVNLPEKFHALIEQYQGAFKELYNKKAPTKEALVIKLCESGIPWITKEIARMIDEHRAISL